MLLKNHFNETSKYFLPGRCCPVNVNTIEEPLFLSRKACILLPVKFYAVEEPIFYLNALNAHEKTSSHIGCR